MIQGNGKFLLLILGGILQGVTYASSQNLRFAVIQFATPETAPKAVAYVIGGGVFATVIGPEVSKYTRTSLRQEYAGSFILLLGIYVGMIIIPHFVDFGGVNEEKRDVSAVLPRREVKEIESVDIDSRAKSEPAAVVVTEPVSTVDLSAVPAPTPLEDMSPRPIWEIAMRWPFILMLLCQLVSYSGMAGLMVATPVAMKGQDFSFNDSTSAIQFHMVGMFLPSFFSGEIIAWLGKIYTMLLGFIIMLLGAVVFYAGETLSVFWVAICIVGVGWNLSFVPSTALMSTLYRNNEKGKTQGFVDIFVVGSVAVAITSAGAFYVSSPVFCC